MKRFYLLFFSVVVITLAVFAGYYYMRTFRAVSIINNDPNLNLELADNERFTAFLDDWGVLGQDTIYSYNPDYQGYSKRKVKNLVIQVTPDVQGNGSINEAVGKKTFSYGHQFVNDTLFLLVHIDRDYYDSPDVIEKRNQLISSGIVNVLFTIFRPSPLFNRQQVQNQIRLNAEQILAGEPIFVYE